MLYRHNELKKKGLSDYNIKGLVKENKLYKIDSGLYATTKEVSKLAIITTLHPDHIITSYSAYYYYGLIKKEPSKIFLASIQKARKIKKDWVHQTFMKDNLHKIGMVTMTYQQTKFNTYNLERLLIELVRHKTEIDYDTYQEIYKNFKKIKKLLNKNKLQEYIPNFKDKRIQERIDKFFEEK